MSLIFRGILRDVRATSRLLIGITNNNDNNNNNNNNNNEDDHDSSATNHF
jgi:hypothetical protein